MSELENAPEMQASGRKRELRVFVTFLLFATLAFAHLPTRIFPHIFDKNSAPQFITLALVATFFSCWILLKPANFQPDYKILFAIYALVGVLVTSAFLSPSVINSFTGDTGRYTGVISTFCLVVIAVYHSDFSLESFQRLISFYLIVAVLQALIGICQRLKFIDMPGDHGMTGTLGNQDFYVAFLGISAPLFLYKILKSFGRERVLTLSGLVLTIVAAVLTGPIQIYVDYFFTLLGFSIFLLRRRLLKLKLSLNAKTFLGTFAIIIWAEFIFLFPFLGHFVPVLGNDTQVKIRANFWLAGMKQFFDHPLFGVGPDHYGNFYESYRTVSDVQNFPSILSNDAHSASVQTFATLGIAGVLAIFCLITFLVRSILILWERKPDMHLDIFFLSLFIFVYLTNSFISPMVLLSKYLLWAIGGWFIGQVYRVGEKETGFFSVRAPVTLMVIPTILIAAFFSIAQYHYAKNFERYAKDQTKAVPYQFSAYIPCYMYFEAQFQMIKNSDISRIEQLALEQVAANRQCVSPRIILAQIYQGTGQTDKWGEQVKQLVRIAPTRSQVLTIAMEFAIKTQDQKLAESIQRQFGRIGLVYVPGKTG